MRIIPTAIAGMMHYFLVSLAVVIISYMYRPPYIPNLEFVDPVKTYTFQDSVAHYIYKLDFDHPHIIMAQAKLESANFRSYVFRKNNNMFGMRFPRKRETVAIKDLGGYSYYESWMHSIIDLRLYYSELNLDGRTEDEVYAFLGRRYAEDPRYVSALKQIVKRENLKQKFIAIKLSNDNIVKL